MSNTDQAKPLRAVIYTRASLDRTGEGKSTERQHDECVKMCDYKGWTIVGHETDNSISAYGNKARPGWERVLKMIEAGEVDLVAAYHLDRLTRSMSDLERLIILCDEYGVGVATKTGDMDLSNDQGRMIARILAAVARQEVERKAARQKLAHAQRRAEGRPWSAVKMLGYTRQGEVIPHEADEVRRAVDDLLNNRRNLSQIGRDWQGAGLTSPYKDDTKPWTPRGVKAIVLNPRIAGLMTYKGEVVGPGDWEPIVDEATLATLTAMLNAPARTRGTVKTGRAPANLLTAIATCSNCGSTLRAGSKRGLAVYQCNNWCVQVEREAADAIVRQSIAGAAMLMLPGAVFEHGKPEPLDTEQAAATIAELRERQNVIANSFAMGQLSQDAYESAIKSVSEQIASLESSAGALDYEALKDLTLQEVRNFASATLSEQRRIVQRVARVEVLPSGRKNIGAKRQVRVAIKARRNGEDIEVPGYEPVRSDSTAQHGSATPRRSPVGSGRSFKDLFPGTAAVAESRGLRQPE